MNIKYVPLKKFGQNFLINIHVIKKIIKIINPKKFDKIFEIGSGWGSLTLPISKIVNLLNILEIDEKIFSFFLNNVKDVTRFRFFLGDVLKFNFSHFFKFRSLKNNRLFGNLPYNISTVFLLKIIQFHSHILDMHFMFQKEVAERLLATPGTSKYGRLSVIVQHFFEVFPVLTVKKDNFFPKPKVDSIFLRFLPHKKYVIYNKKYVKILGYVTKLAFGKKRKILRNNFKNVFSESELLSVGILPNFRAEEVSVFQYFQLVIILKNKNIFF